MKQIRANARPVGRGNVPVLAVSVLMSVATIFGWDMIRQSPWLLIVPIGLVLAANLLGLFALRRIPTRRLRACRYGVICLRGFCWSLALSLPILLIRLIADWPGWWNLLGIAAVAVIAESLLFWNGMICVYLTSLQLGLRHRLPGLLLGLVPILNLILLRRIIRVVSDEVIFESRSIRRDEERASEQICATKYPILLVHGVFFRDYRFLDYWGRIPAALRRNGAKIYYGEHSSAASVADCGAELAERIRKIVRETGCGKVNVIAHSKGGLDSCYAIARCGAADCVASLTTLCTPYRGCAFADYLLDRVPDGVQQTVASGYNAAMRKLGDASPDFMAAVRDLTAARCREMAPDLAVPPEIFRQSFGSVLTRASGGRFPLNFTYLLAESFDGPNDGLVSVDSARWGDRFTLLESPGKRGISHGDMIDLNRENIPGFDVREFYVHLVAQLKQKGL